VEATPIMASDSAMTNITIKKPKPSRVVGRSVNGPVAVVDGTVATVVVMTVLFVTVMMLFLVSVI